MLISSYYEARHLCVLIALYNLFNDYHQVACTDAALAGSLGENCHCSEKEDGSQDCCGKNVFFCIFVREHKFLIGQTCPENIRIYRKIRICPEVRPGCFPAIPELGDFPAKDLKKYSRWPRGTVAGCEGRLLAYHRA